VSFLHSESHLDRGDIAVVTLDRRANVMLLDDINFSALLVVSRQPHATRRPLAENWLCFLGRSRLRSS
jgi:hypothetical protein